MTLDELWQRPIDELFDIRSDQFEVGQHHLAVGFILQDGGGDHVQPNLIEFDRFTGDTGRQTHQLVDLDWTEIGHPSSLI